MTDRAREPDDARRVRTVRPKWRAAVFVCGKCLKRHGDGKALRRALKDAVAAQKHGDKRRVTIVRTRCLGLCPKGAVVLASASTLARGTLILAKSEPEIVAAMPTLLRET